MRKTNKKKNKQNKKKKKNKPIDELGFKHVKLQSEGRPPYNPATLLKLYLYGYKHSIRSSRKLEHFL